MDSSLFFIAVNIKASPGISSFSFIFNFDRFSINEMCDPPDDEDEETDSDVSDEPEFSLQDEEKEVTSIVKLALSSEYYPTICVFRQ